MKFFYGTKYEEKLFLAEFMTTGIGILLSFKDLRKRM
jgi:hypothetical protein